MKSIKKQLIDQYDSFKRQLELPEYITRANLLTPIERDGVSSKVNRFDFNHCKKAISVTQRKAYDQVRDAIRHREPDDPNLLNYSEIVSSVSKLNKNYKSSLDNNGNLTRDNRPAVFVGNKGSGKTTSLNIFTKINNDSFLDDAKDKKDPLLIIRGSAEEYNKLNELYPIASANRLGISLEAYFEFRLAYVVVRNRDREPFKTLLNDVSQIAVSVSNRSFVSKSRARFINKGVLNPSDSELKQGTMQDLINYIDSQIELNINPAVGQASGIELVKILKDALEKRAVSPDSTNIRKDVDFGQFGKSFIQSVCQFSNIIFVLDGIDNVYGFSEQANLLYTKTIGDISDQFRFITGNTTDLKLHYLVACRRETFREIQNNLAQTTPRVSLRRIQHTDDDHSQIFNKKQYLLASKLTGTANLNTDNAIDQELINFYSKPKEYIDFTYKLKKDCNLKNPMEIFSYNHRSRHWNLLAYGSILGSFMENTKTQPSDLGKNVRYNLFLEGLFSGGRTLIRSSEILTGVDSKFSSVLPNPFNYKFPSQVEERIPRVENHSLVVFALIDTLQTNAIDINDREGIVEHLVTTYKFNIHIINDVFFKLVQYRIVEPKNIDSDEHEKYIEYQLTPASKLFKHIINISPDIVARLALDSSIHEDIWIKLSKSIEDFSFNSNYLEIVTILSTRFTAYINKLSAETMGKELISFDTLAETLNTLITSAVNRNELPEIRAAEIIGKINL